MAFLRSDVLNKDLVEKVLKRKEGTNRVQVLSLTIGNDEQAAFKPTLLEDRLTVQVSAKVKGYERSYLWTAKIPKIADSPRNYSRFQVRD